MHNPRAAALLGPPPAASGPAAGLAYRWFTDPGARRIHPAQDHPHHSRVFVADLRAVAARRGGDPVVTRMVAAPRRRSEEFTALWGTRDVALRRTLGAGRRGEPQQAPAAPRNRSRSRSSAPRT